MPSIQFLRYGSTNLIVIFNSETYLLFLYADHRLNKFINANYTSEFHNPKVISKLRSYPVLNRMGYSSETAA